VHVRRNVFALVSDGPEISALRAGVQAMKDMPANDPRSWTYQAAIHGSVQRPPDELAAETWNMC
jgi:tyrosinase